MLRSPGSPTQPISLSVPSAKDALELLFEDIHSEDAKRWYSQPFSFHHDILVQKRGGPCGVLSVVQAHVILYMKFINTTLTPAQALQHAVWEILSRAALPKQYVTLATRSSPGSNVFSPNDDVVQTVVCNHINDVHFQSHEMFTSSCPAGIILFVLSLLFSKELNRVKQDLDDADATLTGRFGHCGQELLNLMLTGTGSSQLHDFTIEHDSGLKLRGIFERPRIGLLTQMECYRLVKVGSFLKNPQFPIWILSSESHFTVLYCEDLSAFAQSKREIALENCKRVFHHKDVQDNGFVQYADVLDIANTLFSPQSQEEKSYLQDFISQKFRRNEICLWTDFWRIIGPLLQDGKTLQERMANSSWPCEQCTFLNSSSKTACDMCTAKRPAVPVPNGPDWQCANCTMPNIFSLDACMMCLAPKPTANQEEEEENVPLRTLQLYHVNGLVRVIQGEEILPTRVGPILVSTVDPALAFNGSSKAFEEVLQTKWTGAVFDYGEGGSAPSIVG